MTRTTISTVALAAALGLAGFAQAQPSGGPAAKGNAPLKAAHTVNDGQAKHGANSFTQGQAQTHIEKAGFTGVTGLTKGSDGVWRGQAMRDGRTMDVAMDFKGNVTTSGGASTSTTSTTATSGMTHEGGPAAPSSTQMTDTASTGTAPAAHHHARRHHRRHHVSSRCAAALRAGAACSGVDKNDNGISDKEDRLHHQ